MNRRGEKGQREAISNQYVKAKSGKHFALALEGILELELSNKVITALRSCEPMSSHKCPNQNGTQSGARGE